MEDLILIWFMGFWLNWTEVDYTNKHDISNDVLNKKMNFKDTRQFIKIDIVHIQCNPHSLHTHLRCNLCDISCCLMFPLPPHESVQNDLDVSSVLFVFFLKFWNKKMDAFGKYSYNIWKSVYGPIIMYRLLSVVFF